ncbi:MAG: hypothetical protein ACLFSM_06180 [Thermoplasmata archaeon]
MMIQWLQSKMALIIVGLVLISSLTTIFYLQTNSLEKEELKDRCREISRVIEEVDDIEADIFRQNISFDEDSKGFYVNPEVGGETYTIEIHEDLLVLKVEGRSVTRPLDAEIHLWDPSEMNETSALCVEEENWRDSQTNSLKIESSGEGIQLRKLQLRRGESLQSHVFVSEVDNT